MPIDAVFNKIKIDTWHRNKRQDEQDWQDVTNQHSNPVNPYNIYPLNVEEILLLV